MIVLAVLAVVVAFMLLEAHRARANERRQLASGGIEPAGDVYPLMQLAYPGVFGAMLVEGALRGPAPAWAIGTGAAVFAVGKALKWWAILTLGRQWTFRVVVVPGMSIVRNGPYRLFRHPNYVGVAGELVGVLFMTGAWTFGSAGTLLFVALMLARVRVENRALDAILRRS